MTFQWLSFFARLYNPSERFDRRLIQKERVRRIRGEVDQVEIPSGDQVDSKEVEVVLVDFQNLHAPVRRVVAFRFDAAYDSAAPAYPIAIGGCRKCTWMIEKGLLDDLVTVGQSGGVFGFVPVRPEDRHDDNLFDVVPQVLVFHELDLLIDDACANQKRDGDRELNTDEGLPNPLPTGSGSERAFERFIRLKRGEEKAG
jgi:hypothetical protein